MHPLNELTDRVFVLYINLKELEMIKYKVDKIKVEYFKGVNGRDDTVGYQRVKNSLSPGSYGHVCSFIAILREAINKKYKRIVIFEPDIYFCKGFEEKCEQYLKKEFKLLYLGCSQNKYYKEETWDKIKIEGDYYTAYKSLGTFAVILDSSIFDEYLVLLETFKYTSDVCLVELQEKYNGQCIVTYPNLISCNVVDSSTSNRLGKIDQVQALSLYRWMRDYEFVDLYKFSVNKDQMYQVQFEVNSFMKGYLMKVCDGDKLLLEIREVKLLDLFAACAVGKKIYLKPKTNNVTIIMNGIFIYNIECVTCTEFYLNEQNIDKFSGVGLQLAKYYNGLRIYGPKFIC